MQQLTKSLGSFTWAMSLFGVQQITNALGMSSGEGRSSKAIKAMDEVTRVSLDQCGKAVRDTFDVGDRMQRGMIDLMIRFIPMGSGENASEMCSCMNPMDMMCRADDLGRNAIGMPRRSADEEWAGAQSQP